MYFIYILSLIFIYILEKYGEHRKKINLQWRNLTKSWFIKISEKAMAPHSSTLAWKIPWMEEPGGLQSMGSWRVGHDWSDLAAAANNEHIFTLSPALGLELATLILTTIYEAYFPPFSDKETKERLSNLLKVTYLPSDRIMILNQAIICFSI